MRVRIFQEVRGLALFFFRLNFGLLLDTFLFFNFESNSLLVIQ